MQTSVNQIFGTNQAVGKGIADLTRLGDVMITEADEKLVNGHLFRVLS